MTNKLPEGIDKDRRTPPSIELELAMLKQTYHEHYVRDEQMHAETAAVLRELKDEISREISTIKTEIATIKDVVTAWNNVKGFSNVTKFLAGMLIKGSILASAGYGLMKLLGLGGKG